MSVTRIIVATSLALAAALATLPSAAASPTSPVARLAPGQQVEVRVQAQAYEGQYRTVDATLRVRCRSSATPAGLDVTWTQGDLSSTTPVTAPACDGRWHVVPVRSPEGYSPGRLEVAATVRVQTPGGTVVMAQDSEQVYARPGALVRLPRAAQVLADGSVRLTAVVRCDPPWLAQDLGFSVSQGEFPDLAAGSRIAPGPTCDGREHRVTVRIVSVQPGQVFRRGSATISGSLSTLDPVNFDPAPSAQTSRSAWLR